MILPPVRVLAPTRSTLNPNEVFFAYRPWIPLLRRTKSTLSAQCVFRKPMNPAATRSPRLRSLAHSDALEDQSQDDTIDGLPTVIVEMFRRVQNYVPYSL